MDVEVANQAAKCAYGAKIAVWPIDLVRVKLANKNPKLHPFLLRLRKNLCSFFFGYVVMIIQHSRADSLARNRRSHFPDCLCLVSFLFDDPRLVVLSILPLSPSTAKSSRLDSIQAANWVVLHKKNQIHSLVRLLSVPKPLVHSQH